MQLARWFLNVWSRQAWLHAMQVMISSLRRSAAFATKSGSASNGRAIETRSAWPEAMMPSATSGVLIRLEATTGTGVPFSCRASRSRAVYDTNAARGTDVTMVGTRASCQPMPVLMIETPACCSVSASSTVSSQDCASSTRSSRLWRYMTMKSSPTSSRVRRTISTGKRIRFSAVPPHASSRVFVRAVIIWLMR